MKKAILIIYLILTSLWYCQTAIKNAPSIKSIPFFFQNNQISKDTYDGIYTDGQSVSIWETRILHNKLVYACRSFFVNLSRSVDIPYLYSLSSWSSLYENQGKMNVLPGIELPVFFISFLIIIRNFRIIRSKYPYFLLLLLIALLIQGSFLPPVHPLKSLPLVIVLRMAYFIGLERILNFLWKRK